MVDFLYHCNQMLQSQVNQLMDLWAAGVWQKHPEADPPFANHQDLLNTIDSTIVGSAPWQLFLLSYTGPVPTNDLPSWMFTEYEVWFQDACKIVENILENPDYNGEIDLAPYKDYDVNGKCCYKDLMSGDWAWKQAVCFLLIIASLGALLTQLYQDLISSNLGYEGCAFVPIIAGSDKTTVSVATGQNEFYLLYISIGNVHNSVHHAHWGAVTLLAFLAIPKCTYNIFCLSLNIDIFYFILADRYCKDDSKFHNFQWQLFHSSLSAALKSLLPGMTKYEVMCFPDGHLCHVIFGLGPYIADYPEQALLAGILYGWCLR